MDVMFHKYNKYSNKEQHTLILNYGTATVKVSLTLFYTILFTQKKFSREVYKGKHPV